MPRSISSNNNSNSNNSSEHPTVAGSPHCSFVLVIGHPRRARVRSPTPFSLSAWPVTNDLIDLVAPLVLAAIPDYSPS
jgi:hypothetical protein